jgi:hypothetical protein
MNRCVGFGVIGDKLIKIGCVLTDREQLRVRNRQPVQNCDQLPKGLFTWGGILSIFAPERSLLSRSKPARSNFCTMSLSPRLSQRHGLAMKAGGSVWFRRARWGDLR